MTRYHTELTTIPEIFQSNWKTGWLVLDRHQNWTLALASTNIDAVAICAALNKTENSIMTTKPLLIELPSGDFVDPNLVIGIHHYPATDKPFPSDEQIVISTSNGCPYSVTFGKDRDAAKAFQRDFGKQINSLRSGEKSK